MPFLPRRSRGRVVLLAATVLATGAALGVPQSAVADETAPAVVAGTTVTAKLDRTKATLGKKVVLRGTTSGARRTVQLQTRDAKGSWRTLVTKKSTASGTYTFRTPTWNRTHPLRVHAPATAAFAAGTSKVVKLKRTVPKTTGGKASAWKPLMRGTVARWNPCQTHRVRVNTKHAPKWFVAETKAMLKNAHLYTGIDFDYAGTTKQRKASDNGAWKKADLVIVWSDPQNRPELSGPTAGIGGAWSYGKRFESGFITLDRTEKISRDAWRAVMRHEMAHVMGLGHVGDRKQRMSATTVIDSSIGMRSRTWGKGDVTGLKRIGATHGCN